ncbi:MAG: hypothetical protein R2698_13520 [Microthrixaceae bacterium]
MAGLATDEGAHGRADGPALPGPVPGGAAVAVDLVYTPRRTAWLAGAERRGAATMDGVGMLVGQAAIAFTRWTGIDAPVDVMTAAAEAAVGAV